MKISTNLDVELVELISALEKENILVTSYKSSPEAVDSQNKIHTYWVESGTELVHAN